MLTSLTTRAKSAIYAAIDRARPDGSTAALLEGHGL